MTRPAQLSTQVIFTRVRTASQRTLLSWNYTFCVFECVRIHYSPHDANSSFIHHLMAYVQALCGRPGTPSFLCLTCPQSTTLQQTRKYIVYGMRPYRGELTTLLLCWKSSNDSHFSISLKVGNHWKNVFWNTSCWDVSPDEDLMPS